MSDAINKIQNEFFETLREIQETAIYAALNEHKEGDSTEDLLYNATFEAICEIMTMLDGYKNDKIRLDLIDCESKLSLKTGIQLHDKCVEYLKFESLEKKI